MGIPFWVGDDTVIGPDLRVLITNQGQIGANGGGIVRRYNGDWDRIFGAAAYYDVDHSSFRNTYTQTTLGLETLGDFWDLRGNLYYVPGTQDNFLSNGAPLCVSGAPSFSGNNIVFVGQQAANREQAMSGFDAEFGMPVTRATPWLRMYAGAYYYRASQVAAPPVGVPIPNQVHSDVTGFRARMDAWVADDLLLGVNVTTDPVWGTNVNGMVDFRFSGFKPTRYFPQWTTRERMLAPWQRNWRIAVEQYGTAQDTLVAAVNPTTGKPYFITFIDNSAAAGGDGSFEHPFNSFNHPNGISGADIILVERGNSTLANPYLGTMKLFDNQLLLGQGSSVAPIDLFAAYGNCTVSGPFTLPLLDGSGNYPFVSNPNPGPAISLANNNQVAGFNIVNGGGDGIFGTGINNFNLHDIQVTGNAGRGIALVNATGTTTIIQNINVGASDYANPNGIGNNAGGGLFLTTGAGGIGNLQLTNVNMNSQTPPPGARQPFGISLSAVNGDLTTTLTNVHVNNNVTGLVLSETNRNLNATFLGLTANGNTGTGIDVTGSGGSVTLTGVSGGQPVSANGNGGDNLSVAMTGGLFNGSFLGATFNNSVAGSGVFYSQNGGTGALSLNTSQLNGNGLDGLSLLGAAGSITTVTVTDSQLNGNTRDGIHNVQTGGSTVNLAVDPTTLNNNGRDGFFYDLSGASKLTASFDNDSLIGNIRSAFYGQMDNSTATLTLTNVQATTSGQNGFALDATNSSIFNANVTGGSFSNSGANGISVALHNLTTGNVSLSGTADSNNGQNGVAFLANNSIFSLAAQNSTFNSNGANGFTGTLQAGATGNVNVSDSSISGNANNGVTVATSGLSNIVATFNNTAINNNTAGNGVQLTMDNSPASSLALTGTTSLSGNGQNGLLIDATTNTVFTPTLSGTKIQGNGADGVKIDVASGSTVGSASNQGAFTNVLILDNAANGAEVNVNGVGSSSNLVFTNAQITNTVGTLPQQIGFLYDVTGGGQLTASFGGGTTLANHNLNAINGTVVGTGAAGSSSATITLTGVNAGGNGQTNGVANVSNGGSLTFSATNTSFSNSANGAGLQLNVAGVNSFANFDLDTVTLNNNATIGLDTHVSETVAPVAGQTGASLNVCLDNSSVSNNTLQGIKIIADGPGATASFGVGTLTAGSGSTVNNNGSEGVLGNAINRGVINFREIGSHFDGNGTTVQSDGVNFGGDNGVIRTLFYGGSADGNSGNGVRVGAIAPNASTNNSDLSVSLGNGFSASNNGLYGLVLDGTGANSANLIQDPNSPPIVLSGNGSGPENLNFAGANQVLLQLLGSFNGSSGDGVHLTFANINTAIVSINGLGNGTIDNNTGNGIYIKMVDVNNAAVAVSGYNSISNNGADGVHIEMEGITKTINGAIEIAGIPGQTAMANNGMNGVNIQLTKTNLVDPFNSLPGVNLTVLTTTDSQSFNSCIPLPVLLAPGGNGVIPSAALRIDSLNVTDTGAAGGTGGIQVNGVNSTIVANDAFITNNSVANSTNGGGIGVTLTQTVAPTTPITSGLQISGNSVTNNTGNGIAVILDNSAVPVTVGSADNLQITNNDVTSNTGDGILVSIINAAGSNTSANGMQINGNTVQGNTGTGILSLLNASGSTMTANGAQFLNNTVSANGSDGLAIAWDTITSNGLDLSGLTSTNNVGNGLLLNLSNDIVSNVGLSNAALNGNSLDGVRMLLTNTSVATLTSTNLTIANNTQTGFDVIAKGASSLTGATFTNASIRNNGQDGVNLDATDGSLETFGTALAPIIFNTSSIIDNGQNVAGSDGVRVRLYGASTGNLQFNGTEIGNTNPAATQQNGFDFILGSGAFPGGQLTASFTNSQISGNNGDGIIGIINGTGATGGSAATVSLSNTVVMNNIGAGADFAVDAAATLGLIVSNNSLIDHNGSDGIHVNATDTNTHVGAFILDSTITNNGQLTPPGVGDGFFMNLDNNATANLTVTNATIGNTSPGGAQQNGLVLNVNQNTVGSNTNLIADITNSTISNNAISGIAGNVTGNNVGLNPVNGITMTLTQVTADSNGGNGVAFNVDNGALLALSVDQSAITNSGANGMYINATNQFTLVAIDMSDTSLNNNGSLVFPGDGFNGTVTNGATLNVCAETTSGTATPMSFSGNFGDGFDVLVSDAGSRADIDFHEVIAGASAANGLAGNALDGTKVQVFDGGELNLRANMTHFDGNGGAGLLGSVNDTNGNDTVGRFRIIGGSADNNLGDGYSLSASNTTGVPVGVATLTAQFQADDNGTGISAQNNGGFGLNFVASNLVPPGGGIVGNLLMTGGSTLLGNGAGTLNVDMNGADQAIIGLSGTFDGSTTGDGIHIDLQNITGLALVSLQGPGEVRNNAGDGIDVSMTNVAQGGVFIGGFSDVSNNGSANNAALGQDGIKVTMSNVGLGAVTIDAHTASQPANIMNVSNNTGNGVNVIVNNGSVIDNTSFNAVLGTNLVTVIDYTAPEQPCPTPLPNPLLTTTPVNVSTALGITFQPTLAIQNLTVDNNGTATGGNLNGNGIMLTVDTLAQIVGTPTINDNTVTNTGVGSANGQHDGILAQIMGNADVQSVDLVNNDVENNNGNGIVALANLAPTLASLNISNNVISGNTGTIGSTGNGIMLQLQDAQALATVTIDNNTVTNNHGDGFQMLNPNTGATNLTVNFTHNLFDSNGSIVPPSAVTTYPPGGMGIDIVLNNLNATQTTINILSDATGVNTISNSASYGLFLQATNQAVYNLNVTGTGGPNVFDGNTDAGIGIVAGSYVNPNNSLDPTKFSVGSIQIDNVLVENTHLGSHPSLPSYPFKGDGIGILAQQYSEIAKFVIGDATARNTLLTGNDGDGLKINAIENSQFRQTLPDRITAVTPVGQATVLLQNVDATGNGGNGVNIIHRDNALLSWDDPTVNPGSALFQLGNPVSWQYITDGGSFIHLNDVIANNNGANGLKIDTSNAQFPMTRIDIIDTALNGNSQFNGNGTSQIAGNMNGMLFSSSADSITVVHSMDTTVSNNIGNGILITATNASTFGDVLTSSPVGDPTSPTAQPSTFDGMTITGNGTATTLGNGIEIISNNQTTDPANNSSKAVVAISMTGTATHARNLFDSNAGDGFKLTANRFSTNYANLNAIDMRDTQFRQLGGDGVHFITNDSSTSTLNLTNASIGFPTASVTQTGLSGNGVHVTTNNRSTMTMLIGDQSIANPDPFNNPDVSIYGNKLAGILVENTDGTNSGGSRFFGEVYDTASRFNGNRGYSALIAQDALSINQIDSSNFSDNSREGIAIIANSESQSGLFIDVTKLGTWPPPIYDYRHFLNLRSLTVGSLVLTNSTVSNNGNQTPYVNTQSNVNGLEIDVSTYAYVSADIRNNTFHGNTLDDVATASFQASTSNQGFNGVASKGGALGGFLTDGTINPNGKINTPNSLANTPASGIDRIFLEDTAQLDMRFLNNVGDQVSISARGSNNPNMNATGAFMSDQSGAKSFGDTSIFQVNAYHYDVVNTVSSTVSNTIFTGTNILPLDGGPTGVVQDFANFKGPFVNPPGIFTTRNLEAGIIKQRNVFLR